MALFSKNETPAAIDDVLVRILDELEQLRSDISRLSSAQAEREERIVQLLIQIADSPAPPRVSPPAPSNKSAPPQEQQVVAHDTPAPVFTIVSPEPPAPATSYNSADLVEENNADRQNQPSEPSHEAAPAAPPRLQYYSDPAANGFNIMSAVTSPTSRTLYQVELNANGQTARFFPLPQGLQRLKNAQQSNFDPVCEAIGDLQNCTRISTEPANYGTLALEKDTYLWQIIRKCRVTCHSDQRS